MAGHCRHRPRQVLAAECGQFRVAGEHSSVGESDLGGGAEAVHDHQVRFAIDPGRGQIAGHDPKRLAQYGKPPGREAEPRFEAGLVQDPGGQSVQLARRDLPRIALHHLAHSPAAMPTVQQFTGQLDHIVRDEPSLAQAEIYPSTQTIDPRRRGPRAGRRARIHIHH